VAGVAQLGGDDLNRLVTRVHVDVAGRVGLAGTGEVGGVVGVVLVFSSIS